MTLAFFLISQIHLDLVAATVQHIASNQGPGAILVFLTGLDEITKLYAALTGGALASAGSAGGRGVMLAPGSQPLLVLPLHSSLPTEQQQMIFELPPPGGCWVPTPTPRLSDHQGCTMRSPEGCFDRFDSTLFRWFCDRSGIPRACGCT